MLKLKLLAVLGVEAGCKEVQNHEAGSLSPTHNGSPLLQEVMMQPHSLQSAIHNLAVSEEHHPAGMSGLHSRCLGERSKHPVGCL